MLLVFIILYISYAIYKYYNGSKYMGLDGDLRSKNTFSFELVNGSCLFAWRSSIAVCYYTFTK